MKKSLIVIGTIVALSMLLTLGIAFTQETSKGTIPSSQDLSKRIEALEKRVADIEEIILLAEEELLLEEKENKKERKK